MAGGKRTSPAQPAAQPGVAPAVVPEAGAAPAPAARSAGRPKDPAKRMAIICAAADLFLERGYGSASMEAIAQAAQVSKLTLYSHFTDKAALFKAAIHDKCEHYAGNDLFMRSAEGPAQDGLQALGEAFLHLIFSPEASALERLVVAESAELPEVGMLFFEAGPQQIFASTIAAIRSFQAQGKLADDVSAETAAEMFISMVKGKLHLLSMIGLGQPSAAQIRAHVQESVAFFLRAMQPKDAAATMPPHKPGAATHSHKRTR